MDAVERLVAIEEIRRLLATYAMSFDDQDWETFGSLWAEDAEFIAAGTPYKGRETLVEFLSTCLPAGYRGKHMNSPALIDVAEDGLSATGKTDVVWVTQNFENTIVGRYYDTYTKQDGRWLFLSRSETEIEYKAGPPPMADADAARPGVRDASPGA